MYTGASRTIHLVMEKQATMNYIIDEFENNIARVVIQSLTHFELSSLCILFDSRICRFLCLSSFSNSI